MKPSLVPVSFTGGLDTKSDPKQLAAGRFSVLENAVFPSPGQLRLRNGYEALSSAIINPVDEPNITSGQALMAYQNELVLCDVDRFYSYGETVPGWTYKGAFSSPYVTQVPVVRNGDGQFGADGVTHSSGLQCYAYECVSGGVRYCVIDGGTGQQIASNVLLDAHGIKPKVLIVGSQFLLLYVDTASSQIMLARIPVATPRSPLPSVPLTPASGGDAVNGTAPNYDACVSTSSVYVVYGTAGNATNLTNIPLGSLPNPLFLTQVAAQLPTALSIFIDTSTQGPVVLHTYSGSDVNAFSYASWPITSSGSVPSALVYSNVLPGNAVNLTGVSLSSSAVSWFVAGSFPPGGGASDYLTRANFLSSGPTIGTPFVLIRSLGLAGKAFVYQGAAYVPLAHSSNLQNSYFLVDETGHVVTRVLPGQGGGVPVRTDGLGAGMLPETSQVDPTAFRFPWLVRDFLTTFPNTTVVNSPANATDPSNTPTTAIYTQTGVTAYTLDFFDPVYSYCRAVLARTLHVSGGFLSMYSGGAGPMEHGFFLYGELATSAITQFVVGGHLGNALNDAVYWYSYCYRWVDDQGQVHRSAPSIPVAGTAIPASVLTGAYHLFIPTLRVTNKTGVTIEVYRTLANGNLFYLATTTQIPAGAGATNVPLLNDPTVDGMQFIDVLSDANLQGNPQLYTTGNVLEDMMPPPLSSVCVWDQRLWGIQSDNPLVLSLSKQCIPGVPVEFSDFLTFNIEPQGGDCTALYPMADRQLVFKAASFYFIYGAGPDGTGAGDYQDAQRVTTDAGCTNPRSLVTTPAGVFWQSPSKGIYGYDGQFVTHVGKDFDAYNGIEVTSAQLVENANEVRFTLANGVTLCWNYETKTGSVFTNMNAVDSCTFEGLFTYLTPGGLVLQETPGQFSDNGSFIKLRAVTGDIALVGLLRFARLLEVDVLGTYRGAHQLLVGLSHDYNPGTDQQDLITPDTPGSWGSDSVLGGDPNDPNDSTVFGGGFTPYVWRVADEIQTCTSVRVSIESVQDGSPSEGMSLSGMAFLVGMKDGAAKLSSSQMFG